MKNKQHINKEDLEKFVNQEHELAHAFARERYGKVVSHGKEFYDFFNILCPKVHQHFEFGYKPKNAKRFGVKSK